MQSTSRNSCNTQIFVDCFSIVMTSLDFFLFMSTYIINVCELFHSVMKRTRLIGTCVTDLS